MVLSSSGLNIAQSPTRNRDELLNAVSHVPPVDATMINLQPDLFSRSLNSLQTIALESLGSSGKTAVIWLGPGYGIDLYSQPITSRAQTLQFIRYMVNTLLQSRIALYVIFPPDFSAERGLFQESQRTRAISIANPYGGGLNFRTLATQTGGAVYTATNDLSGAMRDALALDRASYTLGYRPHESVKDGRFRQIRVTVQNPNLRVITKSGYYAPELQEERAPQTIQIFQMVEAGESSLPFRGLPLRIAHIERLSDGLSARFTIVADNLPWQSEAAGESLSELTAGGVSLSKEGKKLSSHFENFSFMARSQNPDALARATSTIEVTIAIPSNADRVRLVVSSRKNGRLGCIDVDRETIHAAPVAVQTQTPKS